MEGRKVKGICWFVNGLALVLGGTFLLVTGTLPAFLPVLITGLGVLGGVLGFKFVFPDH